MVCDDDSAWSERLNPCFDGERFQTGQKNVLGVNKIFNPVEA
jgi:hypothetical protein